MSYAHRAGVAGPLNRWNAELAPRFPDAVPLATFHPDDEDLAALADEAWGRLGLAGAKLHCQVGRFAPDDPRLDPLYERAVALGKPIVLHAGRAPEASPFCGAERFAALMGRHPRLTAIVAHMGADEFDAVFDMAERYERVYLDTTLIYTDVLGWRPRRERIVALQDRVLYGSDFPAVPHPVGHALEVLQALDLGNAAEEKIFWRNAARLYGLSEQPTAG
jgi:predicted TIM-barrel fold metal-dependent hydrolase